MNQAQQTSNLAEAIIRRCVPGGDVCDPQLVADNIREFFAGQQRLVPVALPDINAGR